MRRRRFVFGLLSISALAPDLSAFAQQPSRLRRVVNLKSAKALDRRAGDDSGARR
jgi:hypothetical protein